MKSCAVMNSPSGTRARVAPNPSRGGRGGWRRRFRDRVICINLGRMNLDAIVTQLTDFFSTGIGKSIADAFWAIYTVLFPANAEAARPIDIPR